MAQRRMFSKIITNSSKFLMMPQSTQNLYFHLGMNADDDGFCEHFVVMRMTESKPDDLKILHARELVHIFDDKVLIVSDWKENNYIRSDRYTPSRYLEEYKEEIKKLSDKPGIPNDNQWSPQVRLGKDSLGKDNIERYTTPSQKARMFFNNIEEQESFISKLVEKGGSSDFIKNEIAKFVSYWTELNKSGTKQRWETEKTFQVEKRLATWFSRAKDYGNQKTIQSL